MIEAWCRDDLDVVCLQLHHASRMTNISIIVDDNDKLRILIPSRQNTSVVIFIGLQRDAKNTCHAYVTDEIS